MTDILQDLLTIHYQAHALSLHIFDKVHSKKHLRTNALMGRKCEGAFCVFL